MSLLKEFIEKHITLIDLFMEHKGVAISFPKLFVNGDNLEGIMELVDFGIVTEINGDYMINCDNKFIKGLYTLELKLIEQCRKKMIEDD